MDAMAQIDEFNGQEMSPAEMGQIDILPERESNSANIRVLNKFLTDYGKTIQKGDKSSNIVDQHYKKNWLVDSDNMPQLYEICEKLRKDGELYGISIKQGENTKLWFDFDLKLNVSEHMSHSRPLWNSIATKISQQIVNDGLFKDDEKHSIFVLITSRSRLTPQNGTYKDGLHVYTTVRTSKAYRKYITKKIATEDFAKTVFTPGQTKKITNLGGAIDANSYSVLPLLLGATKSGGVPYQVSALIQCDFDGAMFEDSKTIDHENMNLVATFSTSSYMPNNTAYMCRDLQLLPSLEQELSNIKQDDTINVQDDEDMDDNISLLATNDPRARELSDIIDLLAKTRANDYSSWRSIMMALAQYGDKYKIIAKKFSSSWAQFSADQFEHDWVKALRECVQNPKCNIGMIKNMAKTDNAEEYQKVINKSVFKVSMKHIFDVIKYQSPKTASLGHFQFADIIATAFPDKFIAVPKTTQSGQKLADDSDVCYWVYSTTTDTTVYNPGNACKYVAISTINPLSVWISKAFVKVLDAMRKYAFSQLEKATEEADQNTWKLFLSIVGKAHNHIHCNTFKSKVMREFAAISTKINFAEKMDKDPNVMGVYDGLLETGIKPVLVRGLSEHKVSKFAPSKYMEFDPSNPIIVHSLQILLDFCPIEHFDVICYILLFQSQVMSDKKKELIMLNLWGHGRNGKSVIIEWLQNALGSYDVNGYAYKFNTTVLTTKAVSSSAARSDLMPMYRVRYLGSSESGRCPLIYPENLKNILSGESTSNRELFGRTMTGSINAVMMVGTNDPMEYNLISERKRRAYTIDYGSSRRFKPYRAMMTFKESIDPNDKYTKKINPAVLNEHIHDKQYCGALLSILSIIYGLFIMIHKSSVASIVSPNIEQQAEELIMKQDIISKFIKRNCVYSEEYSMTMNTLIDSFIDNYKEEFVIHDREKIQEAFVLNPLINKHIRQEDNKYVVDGIRCISLGEELRDGEKEVEDKSKWKFVHYSEFAIPDGMKLPFDNRIRPTSDASEFAHRLHELYKSCLAEHDPNY